MPERVFDLESDVSRPSILEYKSKAAVQCRLSLITALIPRKARRGGSNVHERSTREVKVIRASFEKTEKRFQVDY